MQDIFQTKKETWEKYIYTMNNDCLFPLIFFCAEVIILLLIPGNQKEEYDLIHKS